jgi:ABC-type multidrug transport system fused ATPase/permease subunit
MPTDDEIWAACSKANATEFINSFPNKLYVGERGCVERAVTVPVST